MFSKSLTQIRGFHKVIKPVQISYKDLKQGIDPKLIEAAFSHEGAGLICVKDIPNFTNMRRHLLPHSYSLTQLPKHQQEELERPDYKYAIGWNPGERIEQARFKWKEDFEGYLGAFYANPIAEKFKSEKGETWENVWPTKTLPSLQPTFMDMSKLVLNIGLDFTMNLDSYIKKKHPGYEENTLHNALA